MKRKWMVLLLLVAMLCSGCGTKDTENHADTTMQTNVTETADTGPRAGLPADLDYDGADVKFHAGLWMHVTKDPLSAYYAEELTGDMLNDTVYSRNYTVVFTGGWFGDTDFYREVDFDFGVLPYPKYDEEQTNYQTRVGTGAPVVAIPVTTKDPSMVSAVLEVMSAEGYYQMRPAYFDTALKNKYSRDEQTREMIDLITGNISVDFGTIYVYVLDSIDDQFKNTVYVNDPNWASKTASWEKSVMTKLDTLLEAFQAE